MALDDTPMLRGFLGRMAARTDSKRRMREFENLIRRGYSPAGAARSINATFGPKITPQTTSETRKLTLTQSEALALGSLVAAYRERYLPRSAHDRAVMDLAEGAESSLRYAFARGILTSADFLTIEISVAATQLLHGLVSGALAMNEPDDPVARQMYRDLTGVQGAVEVALRARSESGPEGADRADA